MRKVGRPGRDMVVGSQRGAHLITGGIILPIFPIHEIIFVRRLMVEVKAWRVLGMAIYMLEIHTFLEQNVD